VYAPRNLPFSLLCLSCARNCHAGHTLRYCGVQVAECACLPGSNSAALARGQCVEHAVRRVASADLTAERGSGGVGGGNGRYDRDEAHARRQVVFSGGCAGALPAWLTVYAQLPVATLGAMLDVVRDVATMCFNDARLTMSAQSTWMDEQLEALHASGRPGGGGGGGGGGGARRADAWAQQPAGRAARGGGGGGGAGGAAGGAYSPGSSSQLTREQAAAIAGAAAILRSHLRRCTTALPTMSHLVSISMSQRSRGPEALPRSLSWLRARFVEAQRAYAAAALAAQHELMAPGVSAPATRAATGSSDWSGSDDAGTSESKEAATSERVPAESSAPAAAGAAGAAGAALVVGGRKAWTREAAHHVHAVLALQLRLHALLTFMRHVAIRDAMHGEASSAVAALRRHQRGLMEVAVSDLFGATDTDAGVDRVDLARAAALATAAETLCSAWL